MYIVLLGTGLICALCVIIGLFADRLPDELFLSPSDQEIMNGLIWDLKVAQRHFDEAVTQGQIESATYEYNMAQKRLNSFRKEVGTGDD